MSLDNVPEIWSVESPDGDTYFLTDTATRFVLRNPQGLGMPPIDWKTFTPYKGDRDVLYGYQLRPRVFVIDHYESTAPDNFRADYWEARARILDILRPNRVASTNYDKDLQHIITVTYDGGETQRSIYVSVDGPPFNIQDDIERANNVQALINVIAHDPVWFDPTPNTVSVARTGVQELVFPITFDAPAGSIVFAELGDWATATINYVGTWHSFPKFTIEGPAASFKAINNATGAEIEFTGQPIDIGETLTIDLSSGQVDIDGADAFQFLSPTSDLVGFRIEPDAIAPDGVNEIQLLLPGYDTTNTSVEIEYTTRYIGI